MNAVKTYEVSLNRRDHFGQRYTLYFPLTWQNKTATIRTGWIIKDGSDVPRLTSCYLLLPSCIRWRLCTMSINAPKLLDIVALTIDLPEYNLLRGQIGTIVKILADGAAFAVEFSDGNGQTYDSVGLYPEQIMVLHFKPAKPHA